MKRISVILTSLLAIVGFLFTASCSSHSDELLNSDAQQDGVHTYNLHLNTGVPDFEGAQSRATTSSWASGSVLYFLFDNVSGKATYDGSSWTFKTNSTLSNTSSAASCTAVYVENPASTGSSSITLNEKSAVYKGTGTYTCSSDDIYVNINLSPVTARMRFKGSYGTQIELPADKNDISYVSSISLSTLEITKSKINASLKVGSDGYTPYIYGTLTNASGNNTIYVKNISEPNDYQQTSFSGTKLSVGSSGYLTIPTNSNYSSLGWSKIAGSAVSGYENGYEYVDLGLSVYWATCNVGASKPEEYGDYFAWGETKPKTIYDWSTYKWCNGSEKTMTKYCTDSREGTVDVDNKRTLELADDAAYKNWGSSWRMPTRAEQDELRGKCTWTWTTQNGVKGYKVTSKTNGNSIFLPAAGYRDNGSLCYDGDLGHYWSSILFTAAVGSVMAFDLFFDFSNVPDYDGYYRCNGFSVRAVCPKEPEHEYVDLGLSVKWATCNIGASKPEEYGDYFAWGETTPKTTYNWSTYKWCNGSDDTMTKYCTSSNYGTVDDKITLDLADDAARANWGGSWRMPTFKELDELKIKCTWTWTIKNNVWGYNVTGLNGNSIFLPAAGYGYEGVLRGEGSYGYYWTSSLYTQVSFYDVSYLNFAYYLDFCSNDIGWHHGYGLKFIRANGRSVRAVCP
ncbi:MAG: fibrobacter succinogenes major paralogous domain-containing protein [Bacteroidaceae bacterium]|nr:fibrobacter succinogenes major paralogous domain-containing protein [Bacteroidaceae bacterium]